MKLIAQKINDKAVPVTIVTGFLGSGKTTLLNHVLSHEDGADYAVLINEFGDTPLDQHMLDQAQDDVVVLPNGCLCCMPGEDIEAAMGTLFSRRSEGGMPQFKRMLIELSGLADPAPLIQLLIGNPLLSRCYRLENVVATVDARFGLEQLQKHDEAVNQIALADMLLITKTDVADKAAQEIIEAKLKSINPMADLKTVTHGEIDVSALQGGKELWRAALSRANRAGTHTHEGPANSIEAISLTADAPLSWQGFNNWFRQIRIRHGDNILRAKGILNIEDEDHAVIVHAVNHIMDPPVMGKAWQGRDLQSQLVMITKGLDHTTLKAGWKTLCKGQRPDTGPIKEARYG